MPKMGAVTNWFYFFEVFISLLLKRNSKMVLFYLKYEALSGFVDRIRLFVI